MKYILLFAVLLLNTAMAQDSADLIVNDNLRVRVYTEPEQQVDIGQQVRLVIELMTDTWFSKAPDYPDLDFDGAIVLQPEQSGGNFTEREQGKTYSGVRHRYLIYPQRAGLFTIPALKLNLAVAVDSKPTDISITSNPVQFTAVMPAAAAQLEQFVTTPEFTAKQSYEPESEEALKVGDALTRTITTSAENALALLLPEIHFQHVAGLQVYPAQAKLNDQTERGRYRGTRIDAATYILEQAGEFELPVIELNWWQPDEQQLHTETLPAISFKVAPNPTLTSTSEVLPVPAEPWGRVLARWGRVALDWLITHLAGITLVAGLLYLIGMLWHNYQARLITAWQAYRRRDQESEAAYFRRFCWSCWSDDEQQIMASFWHWLDRLPLSSSTVQELIKTSCSAQFSEYWQTIERQRYAGVDQQHQQSIVGGEFMSQVAQVRRGLLKAAPQVRAAVYDNTMLNPTQSVIRATGFWQLFAQR